jgi:type II secretory pathway component PulC
MPVGELLEKARSDLISDYSKKSEAMDYLLKFIDDNKPSYQHKFNEAIKASREFSTSALLNIIEAKRKAGIDLFKDSPANPDELQKTKYSYTISGIFYSEKNPFVFINEKVYYINDALGSGKIIKILPNKVVIRFIDYEKEYRVGDVFIR